MEIEKKLYQLRKLSGMTQEQLAEKLNVSRQTISKWEQGASVPDLGSMVKLSKIFHISLDDFLLEERPDTTEKDEKITLEDLMKIQLHNRRMTLVLIGGLIFLMVSAMSAIFVTALYNITVSLQYTLYRYIAVGEYVYAPVNYQMLLLPSLGTGVIGILLCLYYLWKNKKGGNIYEKKD